jgi:hypothetical protein
MEKAELREQSEASLEFNMSVKKALKESAWVRSLIVGVITVLIWTVATTWAVSKRSNVLDNVASDLVEVRIDVEELHQTSDKHSNHIIRGDERQKAILQRLDEILLFMERNHPTR